MKFIRWIGSFCVLFVVGLYPAFVAETFWNWFAVKAFRMPSISYGEALGLLMMISVWKSSGSSGSEFDQKSRLIVELIRLSLPLEKKLEADAIIARIEGNGSYLELLTRALVVAAASTISLFFGWLIYHYLVQ